MKAFLTFFLVVITLFTSASAVNGKQLILADKETRILSHGKHHYELLELREGSKLIILGSTEIFVDKLISGNLSSIQYKKGEARDRKNKHLIINTLDASQVSFLHINTDGADGVSAPRLPAENKDKHGLYKAFSGSSGASGGDGENAFDVILNLAKLPESSTLIIDANGGRGGSGQPGGNGDHGFSQKDYKDCISSGHAGIGGQGGKGGDAGQISVFFLVDSTSPSATKEAMRKTALRIKNNRGGGGRGGSHGEPGKIGDCGKHTPRLKERYTGHSYTHANDGSDGRGPRGSAKDNWVTIRFKLFTSFQRYYLSHSALSK